MLNLLFDVFQSDSCIFLSLQTKIIDALVVRISVT